MSAGHCTPQCSEILPLHAPNGMRPKSPESGGKWKAIALSVLCGCVVCVAVWCVPGGRPTSALYVARGVRSGKRTQSGRSLRSPVPQVGLVRPLPTSLPPQPKREHRSTAALSDPDTAASTWPWLWHGAALGCGLLTALVLGRGRRPQSVALASVAGAKATTAQHQASLLGTIEAQPDEGVAGPFPLLGPGYTHVSPGVCDACLAEGRPRREWAGLLLGQFPSHRSNIQRTAQLLPPNDGAQLLANYEIWERKYEAYLQQLHEAPCTLLDMVLEKERMLRAHGIPDPFHALKLDENEVALRLYPALQSELDVIWTPGGAAEAAEAMLLCTVECALAGNLFDAGAARAVTGMAAAGDGPARAASADPATLDPAEVARTFATTRARVARPAGGWRYDTWPQVATRALARPWQRAVVFCDNAGADVLSMTLLARQLLQIGGPGARVALVANSTPALNDITCSELVDFVAGAAAVDPALAAYVQSGQLVCLPSGQQSTLLDLSQSGSELNGWVQMELKSTPKEEWLVVLDGMGRSLESNWQAGQYFKEGIDVLSLAMIKSEINAQRLEAEVYDCVVRLHGAETAASAV